MKLSDRVTIATQAMARQVDDETIILDLATGTYFGLDAIGARIWQLLGDNQTLAEICDVMLQEYDVAREELQQDVLELAEKLAAQGLILPAAP